MLGGKVVLDAEADEVGGAVGDLDPARASCHSWRRARAWGSKRLPSVVRSAGAGAGEEFCAECGFQRRDAGGDGGLGDRQPFRRAVEAAGVAEVQEGFEMVDLHGCVGGRPNRVFRSIGASGPN